jgi:hypothetical protein
VRSTRQASPKACELYVSGGDEVKLQSFAGLATGRKFRPLSSEASNVSATKGSLRSEPFKYSETQSLNSRAYFTGAPRVLLPAESTQ